MKKKTIAEYEWKGHLWLSRIFLALVCTVFLLSATNYQNLSSVKKSVFLWIFGGYAAGISLLSVEGLLIQSYSLDTIWKKLRPKSALQIGMLCYLLFTLVSAVFSPYPTEAWLGGTRFEGVLTIGLCVLCFYYLTLFGEVEKWLIYVFSLSVGLFSILSILQLMGYNPISLYPQGYNYYDAYKAYSGAYLGTIGNVDFVAAFLSLSIPVLWVYILRAKERQKWILLLPLLLSFYVLLKMRVLAGFVGVFAGAALSIPFALPMEKMGKKLYFLFASLLCIAAVVILYFYDQGEGLLHELHCLLHGEISDSFGTGRFDIWKEVLQRIPERFFFGTGPDTMIHAGIEPFRRYDESYGVNIMAFIDAAHSEYLNILYHQGILALLSYVVALLSALWRWMKNGNSWSAAVLGAGAFGYILQAAFGISQIAIAPLFWVCLGLLEITLQNKKIENLAIIKKGG